MTVVGVVVIVVVDVINLVDVVVVVDTIGLLLLLLWISAKEKLKLHFLNFDFTTFFHYFTGLNPDVRLRPVCVVSEGGCVKRPPRPQIYSVINLILPNSKQLLWHFFTNKQVDVLDDFNMEF